MTAFEVRPPCPKCGMNMVKIDARFECLRCGHVEKPAIQGRDTTGGLTAPQRSLNLRICPPGPRKPHPINAKNNSCDCVTGSKIPRKCLAREREGPRASSNGQREDNHSFRQAIAPSTVR